MTESTEAGFKVQELAVDTIPFGTNGLGQPSFYADYIRGTIVAHGVIKLSFVENRLDAQLGEVRSVHVANVVLPITQVRAWAEYLTKLADDQGIPPVQNGPSTNG